MSDQLTISRPRTDMLTLNFERLRAEGLKYIEKLSHRIWTDYNVHDPGITVLELLCYAITDLGYRAAFPIHDLLADPPEGKSSEEREHFYSAGTILPSRPITQNDYRKLLIDLREHANGARLVKNAWFYPADETYYINCVRDRVSAETPPANESHRSFQIKGLHHVLLEFEEHIDLQNAQAMQGIWAKVKRRLHANRNLCEDFMQISAVAQKKFVLCAEVDLRPEASVDQTEARIMYAVQEYLTPSIRSYSLSQMLAKGKRAPDIFEGPRLDHGFIDTTELEKAGLRAEIRLSDIIQEIMKIDDVLAVKDIVILPLGQEELPDDEDKWVLPVGRQDGQPLQPVLDVAGSNIVYYKDLMPFQAKYEEVREHLSQLNAARTEVPIGAAEEDIAFPRGTYRHIAEYYPIQNHLPRTYGIGASGLPSSAPDMRKAQAAQLKAYLLFYDQILANYFKQLAHIKDLFSMGDDIRQTYFTQTVFKDFSDDSDERFADFAGIKALHFNPDETAGNVQAHTEPPELFLQRRNAFIDHLLARFAENFNAYVWNMYVLDKQHALDDAVRAKLNFLREYPEISRNRAKAFDYLQKDELWDTANISGLAHRLARLLGIRNYQRRSLTPVHPDVYHVRKVEGTRQYRFRILDPIQAPGRRTLLAGSWRPLAAKAVNAEMRRILYLAMDRANYRLKQASDGRLYFNVVDERERRVAWRAYYPTEEERAQAIDHLIHYLHKAYSDEGFFIVEHILLRLPEETRDALRTNGAASRRPVSYPPVCVTPDCSDAAYADPYSYRISVILPAWCPRFSDPAFRLFAERTIRTETPAHVLPKICWLDEAQMQDFEAAYQHWLAVAYGGKPASRDQALKNLVEVLSHIRNVYDSQQLTPCAEADVDKPPFILDRTRLGTEEA